MRIFLASPPELPDRVPAVEEKKRREERNVWVRKKISLSEISARRFSPWIPNP
jgi:hypothetical protein